MNGVHTGQYYLSSSYHQKMLSYLSNKVGGFEISDCESWGSKKNCQYVCRNRLETTSITGDLLDCLYISSKFFN